MKRTLIFSFLFLFFASATFAEKVNPDSTILSVSTFKPSHIMHCTKQYGGLGGLFNLYASVEYDVTEMDTYYSVDLFCEHPGWQRCVYKRSMLSNENGLTETEQTIIIEVMNKIIDYCDEKASSGQATGDVSMKYSVIENEKVIETIYFKGSFEYSDIKTLAGDIKCLVTIVENEE